MLVIVVIPNKQQVCTQPEQQYSALYYTSVTFLQTLDCTMKLENSSSPSDMHTHAGSAFDSCDLDL